MPIKKNLDFRISGIGKPDILKFTPDKMKFTPDILKRKPDILKIAKYGNPHK